MRSALLSVIAAAAVLPFATGCGQSSSIVRGQTPAPMQNVAMSSSDACCECGYDCQCGPECECKGGTQACKHGKRFTLCRPYHIPNDLVFPSPCEMPAIVQYPYYTTRGPDDFFHQ